MKIVILSEAKDLLFFAAYEKQILHFVQDDKSSGINDKSLEIDE